LFGWADFLDIVSFRISAVRISQTVYYLSNYAGFAGCCTRVGLATNVRFYERAGI
jgi:hypothetical protein